MNYLALTLPGGKTINPPTELPSGGFGTVQKVLSNAITLFLIFGVIVTLIFLIWGGFQWSSSGGDKAKISAARAKITWAIIGLIVVFLSFFIINIVGYFFKVDLLKMGA